MTDAQLSIPERSALLALMTFVTEASNKEIADRYGFRIERPVRESLLATGFLEAELRGRGFVHRLSDKGWQHCLRALTEPLPQRSHRAYRLLHGLLLCVEEYLGARRLRLADFLDRAAEPAGELPAGDTGAPLREAYHRLAARPGAWVGLARLREELPALSRQEFDAALTRLDRDARVSLIPEANQKALTGADRAAAIHIGGEDKHLVQIRSA